MDSMWSYRSAYAEALKIKQAQDEYCVRAEGGQWDLLNEPFPEDPRWEMLVDVLRGKVKVIISFITGTQTSFLTTLQISSHCYEAVDLDAMVRVSSLMIVFLFTGKSELSLFQLTNEFQFPIASFHHASEAYLVPKLLKQMLVSQILQYKL